MESLTFEDQVEIENAMFERYGSRGEFIEGGMQAIQEEEELARQTDQREINEASQAL